ncbi:TlpA family protein disulfide reductase [Verticiella sediminum]|uniref:TlpA family protein disulfide reductase n=1 Tax=Verticiella sediminum TaxID=1247510 RepID=A0A556AQA1_9BURK|nr:TlpA disulfide reductase family protein [Verticiella sediminum]TSH95089.1 TlpA family protein disulfide reductase [Verticiella sediminum]
MSGLPRTLATRTDRRQRGAARHIVVLILAVAAAIGGWLLFAPAERAPDVAFAAIDGRKIGTEDLRGKVVLVNFWATSCVTCVKKMPMITESYETYRDRGYEVLAVAMSYDPANYVLNFVQTRKLPFTVALDPVGEVAKAFGDVRLTPTSFLIDREGRIVKRYLGDVDQKLFFADIERALAS